jgi:PEP-CTERM motif
MPRRAKLATLACAFVILSAAGISPARAGLLASVSVVIAPEGDGMSLYTYTVSVDPASTSAVSEFDLNLTSGTTSGIDTPVGAPLSSITMANGFINLYTLGDPTISFYSTDPSTDIAAGTSGMFSFISLSDPVSQPYQLSTFDGSGGVVVGSVLAPTSVPEPSTLVLSGLGALGVVGVIARTRRRSRKLSA